GQWSAADFKTQGKLLLKELEFVDDPVNLRGASLDARYSVTPHRLLVSQLDGRLLGGSVSGDVDVTNWLAQPPAKTTRINGPRPGRTGNFRTHAEHASFTDPCQRNPVVQRIFTPRRDHDRSFRMATAAGAHGAPRARSRSSAWTCCLQRHRRGQTEQSFAHRQ